LTDTCRTITLALIPPLSLHCGSNNGKVLLTKQSCFVSRCFLLDFEAGFPLCFSLLRGKAAQAVGLVALGSRLIHPLRTTLKIIHEAQLCTTSLGRKIGPWHQMIRPMRPQHRTQTKAVIRKPILGNNIRSPTLEIIHKALLCK
jgi:hypothetical protein